jgi:hypothetical protein
MGVEVAPVASWTDGRTSSSEIVAGYGRRGCWGRPLAVVEFIRSMLLCLLRCDVALANCDGGVEVELLRRGVLAILRVRAVRYASAGEEEDLNGCCSVGAKVKGAL